MIKKKVSVIPTKEGYSLTHKGKIVVEYEEIENKEVLQLANLQGYCFLRFNATANIVDIVKDNGLVKVLINYSDDQQKK